MTLRRGVQIGFGECLGPGPWDLVESWGAGVVRIGVEPDKHQAADILAEVAGRAVVPVICVDLRLDVAPVVALAQQQLPDYFLELGNEPKIHGYRPRHYAAYCEDQIRAALECGLPLNRICVGSIPNCETETLRWLDGVCALLNARSIDPNRELLVSFHRYARIALGRQTPSIPHQWHATKVDEFASLIMAAGGRQVVCTEFGFDSGVRTFAGHDVSMTLERQAQCCRDELDWMTMNGVAFAVWYQINDGPTNTFIDRYGLRTADGTVKQPLVDALFGSALED